jgi:hypothetical protein
MSFYGSIAFCEISLRKAHNFTIANGTFSNSESDQVLYPKRGRG